MRVAAIKQPGGLENINIVERDSPGQPQSGEVAVRVRANSLNFHDFAVVSGVIPVDEGRIPMSDGAGEVVAIGEKVTDLTVGDAVVSLFFPNWGDGPPTLPKMLGVPGDHADGFAAEQVVMPASAFTRIPQGYSMAEASTLPCAALTAWRAVMTEARIKPGDWVLTQGTGGVSMFALQFAKAAGARVIATSSSDAKLEKLRALGAEHVINYRETPDWGRRAKEMTGEVGVDEVVEIGGPKTLGQSIAACRIGGHISLIGVLTGVAGKVPTAALFAANICLKGITVGSREEQMQMIAAIEANDIRPVLDEHFPLEGIADAFKHQIAQKHFGKICLEI